MMMLTALLLAAAPMPSQDSTPPPSVCQTAFNDSARNRRIPVLIRMPEGTGKAPVILFSHGLGGNVSAGTLWAEPWVRAGFIVIHLQHPGSDTDAVRSVGFRAAMGPEQLIARAGDVRFAIDVLEKHPALGPCDLSRADTDHIGMAGHSFGAHTTLAVAGQRYGARGAALADPRIDAAIAFSPAPPTQPGASDTEAFGGITIPVFSLTGSLDAVPQLTPVTAEDRQRPFRAMAPGGKYLLWIDGANHAAFGGQHYAPRGTAPDSHVEPIIVRMTTLFWRWTLMGDAAARIEFERGDASLGPNDRFESR